MKVPGRLRGHVSEETLDRIARAVDEAEAKTSGEIVVHVVRSLLPFETPRRRALRAFGSLGVGRTRRRNGVLLLLVMKKRRFEIVADQGIDEKVGASVWEAVAREIRGAIEREGFEIGVSRGVALLGETLAKHFPFEERDVNELPDRPKVEQA